MNKLKRLANIILGRCRYYGECEYANEISVVCNSRWVDREYCGEYKIRKYNKNKDGVLPTK